MWHLYPYGKSRCGQSQAQTRQPWYSTSALQLRHNPFTWEGLKDAPQLTTGRGSTSADSPEGSDAFPPSRGGSPLLSYLQPVGSDVAIRNLLQGRQTAILWDLDNVDFFAPSYSAPLQVRRLRALVEEAGGQLVLCRAYGNMDTVRRLAGILPLLEQLGLLHVAAVAVRRDAADVRLVNDALEFVAMTHGAEPAVLCISQDTDFAAPLQYLSERGVRTVAVSPHAPRRRTHAAMEPATYFRRLPLPSACWAALKWEPIVRPITDEEVVWLRRSLGDISATVRDNEEPRTLKCADRAVSDSWSGDGGNATDVYVVHPGLEPYMRLSARCPGGFTRLWLNPDYVS